MKKYLHVEGAYGSFSNPHAMASVEKQLVAQQISLISDGDGWVGLVCAAALIDQLYA